MLHRQRLGLDYLLEIPLRVRLECHDSTLTSETFTWLTSSFFVTENYIPSTWKSFGVVGVSSREETRFHILWGVWKGGTVASGRSGTQDAPGLHWWAQQDAEPCCIIAPGKYSYRSTLRGSNSTAKFGTPDGKYRVEANIKRVHFLDGVSFDLDIDIWAVDPSKPGQPVSNANGDITD